MSIPVTELQLVSGTGLDPKENKATGWGEGPGHRETPCASISRDSRQWRPSLRHRCTDSGLAPPGLVLRQVNSTLASVALRQSWGLSGSCPAETASEDPAHLLSLGFRRQSIKHPGTCTPQMRSNTQGQVGVPQILQHGKQTSLAPGMRTFDPGHQGR